MAPKKRSRIAIVNLPICQQSLTFREWDSEPHLKFISLPEHFWCSTWTWRKGISLWCYGFLIKRQRRLKEALMQPRSVSLRASMVMFRWPGLVWTLQSSKYLYKALRCEVFLRTCHFCFTFSNGLSTLFFLIRQALRQQLYDLREDAFDETKEVWKTDLADLRALKKWCKNQPFWNLSRNQTSQKIFGQRLFRKTTWGTAGSSTWELKSWNSAARTS